MKAVRGAIGLFGIVAMWAGAAPVWAGPVYSFFDITHPGSANAAIGEAQLFMEVLSDADPALVEFQFRNVGPAACSICDVYFDDGDLLDDISSIINGPNVSFSQTATPQDLPGGNSVTPHFVTTDSLAADSDPPVEHNGVNPGEFLGIVLTLQSGKSYGDVLNELTSADLRVGLHVQAFPDEGSDSFINRPCPAPGSSVAPVPAPGAALLVLVGVGLVGHLRRRRFWPT